MSNECNYLMSGIPIEQNINLKLLGSLVEISRRVAELRNKIEDVAKTPSTAGFDTYLSGSAPDERQI